MEKDILLEILKCAPISFTLKEIEDMMDDELGKSPAEMDAELVDICVDILYKAYFDSENKQTENKIEMKAFKPVPLAAIV